MVDEGRYLCGCGGKALGLVTLFNRYPTAKLKADIFCFNFVVLFPLGFVH
jgi:hypothetical protein